VIGDAFLQQYLLRPASISLCTQPERDYVSSLAAGSCIGIARGQLWIRLRCFEATHGRAQVPAKIVIPVVNSVRRDDVADMVDEAAT